MSVVIKVENLSKQYRLGTVGTGSLKDDFKRWRYSMLGREDPFLLIGEENDRSKKSQSDYVWALRNINFEVNQGDVLGIIGRNGAGKSTLLKILSRTTGPSIGSIKMKGRIASLLEVGTGFHGELSGRENIYLNGAIMGLRKHEIKNKLDEIIDFAGVERFIDTPVKRYSSGMFVRLAFGVAAHLDPEIMIVDEVLAVGDTEFQKKAINKMRDVSNKEGRTVLFVSHNMAAIKSLCKTALILQNGSLSFLGKIEDAVSKYIASETQASNVLLKDRKDREGNGTFKFTDIKIYNEKGEVADNLFCNEQIAVSVKFETEITDLSPMVLTVGIKDQNNELIAFFSSDEMGFTLSNTLNSFKLDIPNLALRPGNYSIWLYASYATTSPDNLCDAIENALSITILPVDFWVPGKMIRSRNTAFFQGEFFQENL